LVKECVKSIQVDFNKNQNEKPKTKNQKPKTKNEKRRTKNQADG